MTSDENKEIKTEKKDDDNLPPFEEVSKDWVVKKLRKNKMDALVIDNWYSDAELKKVFTEKDYYMNNG